MLNPYKQDVNLMLVYCWAIVSDAVAILNQYLICVSCLQGRYIDNENIWLLIQQAKGH